MTKFQYFLVMVLSCAILSAVYVGLYYKVEKDQPPTTIIPANPSPSRISTDHPTRIKSPIEIYIESQNLDHKPTTSEKEIQRLLNEFDD